MARQLLGLGIALLLAGLLAAQDRPRRGVIKKVDADKGIVTITVDGKEQANIVRLLHERFANLNLVYLSSRTYGGYATIRLNPEPYAYESGFGVKWLIEQQIKGDLELNFDPKKGPVKAPWLSWGPYLWANGLTKRADGFSSEKEDFAPDGTHHAAAGVRKMGEQVLKFFESDSTTKGWFLASGEKER